MLNHGVWYDYVPHNMINVMYNVWFIFIVYLCMYLHIVYDDISS